MTSTPTSPAAADGRWDARLWGALIILCGVLFLDGLDVSMVGVALPSIESDLGLSTSQLQWIVSGYVLGYGGLLLLGGRAADLLGRRRVLLIALGVFAVASLLGAFVDNGSLLIATRIIKGASAAFTAPAGLSLITTTFPEGPARNKALAIYTGVGASGFSMGLVLGGILTTVGWRWTFVVPGPIAVGLLLLAPRFIDRDAAADPDARRHYDIAGAVTITAAMLLLVRTVVQAPTTGWGDPVIVASFAIVAALVAAFIGIEQRSEHPLVRLGLLRSGKIVRANLGAMTVFGAYIGFQFIGTLYMQSLLGWTALETALAFLPAGLLVAFGAPRIGPLVDRVGTPTVILGGATAFVAGYALFLGIDATPTYAIAILPTILLLGVGFALCFPTLNMQATDGVADHEQGLASGLVQTSFQLGGAIVLAVVTAVVSSRTGTSTDPDAMLAGFHPALGVVTGVAVAGLAVALTGVLTFRRAVEPALARD
jgi:MFS family permease